MNSNIFDFKNKHKYLSSNKIYKNVSFIIFYLLYKLQVI